MMTEKRTALITGATGGLGEELCREFVDHGYNLVITARSGPRLRELQERLRPREGQKIIAIPADLNQQDAAATLVEKIGAAGIQIDILVNNAGFGAGGRFSQARSRLMDAMIRVNILTPTRLCRLLLPGMLSRGYGGILNVASTGGLVPGPYNNVYCATKAYLLHFTEALAEELRDTPIKVTAICPGAMHTGFAHRANMESTLLFNYGVMEPADVARIAYDGLRSGQTVVVPGIMNKCIAAVLRLLPRRLCTRASGMVQKQETTDTQETEPVQDNCQVFRFGDL